MSDSIADLFRQLMEDCGKGITAQVRQQSLGWAQFYAMYKETYQNLSKKKRDEIARAIRIAGRGRAAEAYGYQTVTATYLFHPSIRLTKQKNQSNIFMEVIT